MNFVNQIKSVVERLTSDVASGSSRQYVVTALLCLTLSWILSQLLWRQGNRNSDSEEGRVESKEATKRDFTVEQLRDFNGATEDTSIYISLRGVVYDVSNARHLYGPQNAYQCMAGREASRAMAKLSFDERDLENTALDDLNAFERSTLDDWIEKFEHYKNYPVVGRCIDMNVASLPSMTRSQLSQYRGKQGVHEGRLNASIYVGLSNQVFDVSFGGEELYGEGGPYHVFAGIDASRALAKMSFETNDLESTDLSDLSEEQLKTLAEWVARFTDVRKYPVVAMLE